MSHQATDVPEGGSTRARQSAQTVLVGVLTFLTISAAAMLHVNQPEFLLARFEDITEFEYSLFDGMLYLSYLVTGLAVGALSDQMGRRRVFVTAGAAGSVLFYWLMTTTLNYPLLLLYRFIQGSFTVMVWQTFMTLALDFSGHHDRGRNFGIFGAFLALAMGAGPVTGGIIASAGVFMPYYSAVILNLIVLLVSLLALRDPLTTQKRPSLLHSLAIVKRLPKLMIPGMFNLVDRLHTGFILTALPLFLSVTLGLPESLRGMSLGVFALPFIVLQYPMGRLSDRYGRYPQLIAGSVGFGVTISVFGYLGAYGFSVVLLMLVLMGLLNGMTGPPSMALVGDNAGPDDSAMAMGLFNFMGNVGITVGPLTFGYLVIVTDFAIAFLAMGVLELLTLLLNMVLIKVVFRDSIRRTA